MKKGIFLLIVFCLSLSSVAFAIAPSAKLSTNCLQTQENGCIDWENGIIYAKGMGVPNPKFKTIAQRRYSAYTAAQVVAKRNLLQMIEDIQVSSSQTVKAGMLESDDIKIEIHGTLRQVIEEGRPKVMSDGSTWVTMKMYMKDIRNILVQNEGFEVAGEPMQDQASTTPTIAKDKAITKESAVVYGGDSKTIYTGLILDASGTNVTPAMSPKVLSDKGVEVYGSMNVGRKFAIEHGVASYVKGMEKALTHTRVVGKPLIIKATLGESNKGSDLVISEADANLLQTLAKQQTFLREARVIILL